MIVLVKSSSKLFSKRSSIILYLLLTFFLVSCEGNKTYTDITGPAMGTSYTIRLVPKRGLNQNTDLIKAKIDKKLASIDSVPIYFLSSIIFFKYINSNKYYN